MAHRRLKLLVPILMILLTFLGCQPAEKSKTDSPPKKFRVAILLVSDMYLPLSAAGLQEGMRELGYQEGVDVEYLIYNAKDDLARLKTMAEEIVAGRPDVICPAILPAINAIKDTHTNLPVVFLESMYPVEFGLAESLLRPGANFTGVSNMTGPMSGKRLELFKQMIPGIRKVAVICNPDNLVAKLSLDKTKEAAARLGIELDIHPVYKVDEVDAAIAMIEAGPADALVLNPDFMVFARLEKIAAMARRKKIPTMGIDPTQVEKGLLASYGGGLKDIAAQAARQVDCVLNGQSPAVIPIEKPQRYKLYVNMKTAEEINVTLPDELLFQAEEYYR